MSTAESSPLTPEEQIPAVDSDLSIPDPREAPLHDSSLDFPNLAIGDTLTVEAGTVKVKGFTNIKGWMEDVMVAEPQDGFKRRIFVTKYDHEQAVSSRVMQERARDLFTQLQQIPTREAVRDLEPTSEIGYDPQALTLLYFRNVLAKEKMKASEGLIEHLISHLFVSFDKFNGYINTELTLEKVGSTAPIVDKVDSSITLEQIEARSTIMPLGLLLNLLRGNKVASLNVEGKWVWKILPARENRKKQLDK